MASNNLKKKAASGMVWTAFQKYSNMFVHFISGIILARLLTPHDYGCIGMLTIFMALADTVIDGGFGSALIQKKKPLQEDYSTIFWWNMGMSLVLYGVLFFSAPAIASFYSIPILCPVLRVEALVLFIHAFNLVQRNQLRKSLNFRVLSIVTIATAIISLAITIVLAYKGFGVWALVVQNLFSSAIPAVFFWFYIKWRPLFFFSWTSFKELFGFGSYMFLTHLVNQICTKLNGLLIGRFYSASTLGYFSKASSTEMIAFTSISSVVTQVTYPLYAQAQDNKAVLANMVKRLTGTISCLVFPLMFILIICAKPIFVFLYSDRWLESVPYFQVLCFAGFSACLQAVNTQTIAAIGESQAMFKWTIIKRFFGLAFVIVGLSYWGMKGLLAGYVLNNWFSYFVNIGLVSKYIGYKWYTQVRDLIPVTIVSLLSALGCYYIVSSFHLGLYADGLLKALCYISIYFGIMLCFRLESFVYTLSIIPKRFRFWN